MSRGIRKQGVKVNKRLLLSLFVSGRRQNTVDGVVYKVGEVDIP